MKKLVFIGDSLTEFFDWQERFPGYRVTNLGIAGEPAEGLLARLDGVCDSISGPDFIFLMTGINNIAMEESDIVSTYRTIIERLTSCFRNAVVVVQSILPVRLPWVDNALIRNSNLSLKEVSEEFRTSYLDLYSLFVNPDGTPIAEYLLDDGVHLSSKGYQKWSSTVERFLTLSSRS